MTSTGSKSCATEWLLSYRYNNLIPCTCNNHHHNKQCSGCPAFQAQHVLQDHRVIAPCVVTNKQAKESLMKILAGITASQQQSKAIRQMYMPYAMLLKHA